MLKSLNFGLKNVASRDRFHSKSINIYFSPLSTFTKFRGAIELYSRRLLKLEWWSPLLVVAVSDFRYERTVLRSALRDSPLVHAD